MVQRFLTAVVASWLVMGVIWAFTAPLVAHVFHLVSPVGLLLNVLLVPVVAVVMWFGYAFVVAGTLWEPLATPFAVPFEWGLRGLLAVTEWASGWSLGHRYVSGPAAWWTAGFHLGLLGLLFATRRPRWRVRVAVGVLVWVIVGAVVPPAVVPRPGELRCTFLSVGHGNAVLLEMPNGRTLLYDGGSISAPEYADRVIRAALWRTGRSRLDAIVVSHADVDHFNALPDVLDAVPASTLFVSRSFLDFEQSFVVELCDVAVAKGSRIGLLHAGDRISLDPGVSIRVLHPAPGRDYAGDNEASLVLLVEFGGRRILLTGDLERRGLEELLARDPIDVDVLAAPHHGSPAANTRALAEWATPEHVVVSAGSRVRIEPLRTTYPEARLHITDTTGAVTVVADREGRISCRTFERESIAASRAEADR